MKHINPSQAYADHHSISAESEASVAPKSRKTHGENGPVRVSTNNITYRHPRLHYFLTAIAVVSADIPPYKDTTVAKYKADKSLDRPPHSMITSQYGTQAQAHHS